MALLLKSCSIITCFDECLALKGITKINILSIVRKLALKVACVKFGNIKIIVSNLLRIQRQLSISIQIFFCDG